MKHEPPSTGTFSVVFVDRQRKHGVRKDDLRSLLERAAASLKVSGELTLVFGGDRLLRRLNRDYRFKDKATDVLSFPSPDADLGLGDVIISVETARVNAETAGRPLDRELEILALHGFLHVLGYDHETDTGEMDALERQLRAKLLSRARPLSNAKPLSKRIAA